MAILKFINNSIKTKAGLKKALKYIFREQKTEPYLVGQKDTDIKNVYWDWQCSRENAEKTDGRLATHFVLSFGEKENVSYETAKEAANKTLKLPEFENFQVVFGVHKDKAHTHVHFLINSVGLDGRKWHQTNTELMQLKRNINEKVLSEMKLSVIDIGVRRKRSNGLEYVVKYGRSWVHETMLAADYISEAAKSKDEFVSAMKAIGYKDVIWEENRKYITFVNENGKKVRDKKLDELFERADNEAGSEKAETDYFFSKEALQRRFDENKGKQDNDWKLKRFIEVINLNRNNTKPEDIPKDGKPEKEKASYVITELQKEFRETRETIIQIAKRCHSMEKFIQGMKALDYEVTLSDEYPDLLIKTPNGKYLNTDMLYRGDEWFRVNALKEQFRFNKIDDELNLFIGLVQIARSSGSDYPVSEAMSSSPLEGNALREYIYKTDKTAARFNKNLMNNGFEEEQ